jgi:hypothetical protein
MTPDHVAWLSSAGGALFDAFAAVLLRHLLKGEIQ